MTLEEIRTAIHLPIEILWGCVAMCGGIVRYLVSFRDGQKPFSFGLLIVSSLIAGFSGYMFALLGHSWGMTNDMNYIMAGVGGFFGEQTLRLIFESVSRRSGSTK